MDIVNCPPTSQIVQLLRGQISGPVALELTEHIRTCSRCSQSLELLGDKGATDASLALIDSWRLRQCVVQRIQGAVSLLAGPSTELNFLTPAMSADEIGWLAHYRVLKILGEGGMGISLAGRGYATKADRGLESDQGGI